MVQALCFFLFEGKIPKHLQARVLIFVTMFAFLSFFGYDRGKDKELGRLLSYFVGGISVLVSVIVPVYNVEPYIRRALDSILGQTHQDLEVICINDGSTDGSLGVLQEYAAQDARVRIIDKENGGVVSARQAGLSVAQGGYTTFVDPDDWIEEDCISLLLEENKKYGADVVACGRSEDADGRCRIRPNQLSDGVYSREWLDAYPEAWFVGENFYSWQILGGLCTKLIRTDLIQRIHSFVPETVTVSEDVLATISCIAQANALLVINRPLYHYVYRKHSATTVEHELPRANFIGCKEVLQKYYAKTDKAVHCMNVFLYNMLLQRHYSSFSTQMTLFPYKKVRKGQRIFIYGAGTFGRVMYDAIKRNPALELAGWTDKYWSAGEFTEFPLVPTEEIYREAYDIIVIAILNESLCRQIAEELVGKGIPRRKIDFVQKDAVLEGSLPDWLAE